MYVVGKMMLSDVFESGPGDEIDTLPLNTNWLAFSAQMRFGNSS